MRATRKRVATSIAAGDGTTKIGQRLAELPITLRSDPLYPGLETVPFVDFTSSVDDTSWAFDGGLPIKETTWIRTGVLHELIRNRAHAVRTGTQPTPPADNLIMDGGGTASLQEMIATTKRGLLLTCLWYIREVDPERLLLTGLTRDGVYLVEDGEVVGAVNNFRFNESPIELLGRISEIGAGRADLVPGVERLLQPHDHADHPSARLQHVDRQPGLLTDGYGRSAPVRSSPSSASTSGA